MGKPKKQTKLTKEAEVKLDCPRLTTGSLVSEFRSYDLQFINFSVAFHGNQLVADTKLELNYGRRYGLIGANGSGKSTLLASIGEKDLTIPPHINIFYLKHEYPASDKAALDAVIEEVEEERMRLEAELEEVTMAGDDDERMDVISQQLTDLDPDTAATRAALILHGLGFTPEMQKMKTREFSGGWRMRISLAKALFYKPILLLLDEPTNHLDLEACVWLEEYLKNWEHILVIVSHSQDFMNGVCTNIMHLHNKKLEYYSGNYDTFITTRAAKEEHQMKKFNWEQNEIAKMKDYINRFGHGSAKLARQAKSKEKTLAKMQNSGLAEKVTTERTVSLYFPDPDPLPPPVLAFDNVTFKYPGTDKYIYKNLDLGVDLDSRVALVGPNGAGKSTLIKLMVGEHLSTDGMIKRHLHLRFGRYHQHLTEQFDAELSPCELMIKTFPEVLNKDNVRSAVGRFGLTGKNQIEPIKNLSDGQRSRLAFAIISHQNPHILLLDEPTNHLDIETIDSLADAINAFDGGMVLVSHDFRLITQVADEIWVCDEGTVTKWPGDIMEYKEHLRKKMGLDRGYNEAKEIEKKQESTKSSSDNKQKDTNNNKKSSSEQSKKDNNTKQADTKKSSTITTTNNSSAKKESTTTNGNGNGNSNGKSKGGDNSKSNTKSNSTPPTPTSNNDNGDDSGGAMPFRYVPPHMRKKGEK